MLFTFVMAVNLLIVTQDIAVDSFALDRYNFLSYEINRSCFS